VLFRSYTAGTGTGAINEAWNDTRTLPANEMGGEEEDLDLAGGLVRGGYTYTFTKVKAILIHASASNVASISFGPSAADGFLGPFADATDKLEIPPGGMVLLAHPGAGWSVTGASEDSINFADDGVAGCEYTISIVGVGTKA
jgi:hypothetical protein